jgi:hypothetical protein
VLAVNAEFVADDRHVIGLAPGRGFVYKQADAARVPVVKPIIFQLKRLAASGASFNSSGITLSLGG